VVTIATSKRLSYKLQPEFGNKFLSAVLGLVGLHTPFQENPSRCNLILFLFSFCILYCHHCGLVGYFSKETKQPTTNDY
jgi:hypothetical protein